MNEMPKSYDFSTVEARLYAWWEENGWFKPEARPNSAEPYTIAIPPPNVTGELHMGHAMFVSMEDLMIRRARMQGKAALWVPGTDHAGIATQLQVEKHLLATWGKTRQEIGRTEFLAQTWAWKEKFNNRITTQFRSLGASADWERNRFTLDAGLSEAVLEAFVRFDRMGLIYRGERLVNWSPGLQTAVSDLEVEYSEEQGSLYFFRYPLEEGGYLPVSTTRPETILGDTAVAVHPEDARYRHLIGKTALVPILNRPIPIIGDEYVDPSFGTGALKITPAHDPNDYAIAKRHALPLLNILNKDATLNANAGHYEGLDRFVCRQKLWQDMAEAGLTDKIQPHTLNVPRSQRGGEIIEPMISNQWFLKVEAMAKLALEAVRNGKITIVPDRFVKVWEHWLTDIQDWCISRQLWWGHRIPVYYVNGDESRYLVAKTEEEAYRRARAQWGGDVQLRQDEDVLDTWFSSGLWPFSTLGWPHNSADLARFYPTTMMETGYDILFFWVARMAMMGLLLTNDVPFQTIYLHGLVRDEHGRKMSKSLGNVVDPLLVTAQFGTDALRFTLLTGSTPGQDMNLSVDKVESNRNFANKLWNVARFIIGRAEGVATHAVDLPPTSADVWIMTRLRELLTTTNRLMDAHNYGEAGRQVYEFLWGDFADWYVEIAKSQMAEGGDRHRATLQLLVEVLDSSLRLLHPYIPFVTEETWQQLRAVFAPLALGPTFWPQALIIADWPAEQPISAEASQIAAEFERLRELVVAIRRTRNDNAVPPNKPIAAIIVSAEKAHFAEQCRPMLAQLARLDPALLQIAAQAPAPDNAITISLGDYTCYLPLAGMVDVSKERERLQKEVAELTPQISRLEGLLGGSFAEKAPPAVVQKEREKLELLKGKSAELQQRLAVL